MFIDLSSFLRWELWPTGLVFFNVSLIKNGFYIVLCNTKALFWIYYYLLFCMLSLILIVFNLFSPLFCFKPELLHILKMQRYSSWLFWHLGSLDIFTYPILQKMTTRNEKEIPKNFQLISWCHILMESIV